MPDIACTIRYATIADAPAISTIYVGTTRTTYRDILPAALLDTRPLHHFVSFWSAKLVLPATKEQRILVAEREESVVGFVAIGAASETSKVADDTGELHLCRYWRRHVLQSSSSPWRRRFRGDGGRRWRSGENGLRCWSVSSSLSRRW
jgi:hypothetical protein